MPANSVTSVSTVRTVDDVLSQMDINLPKDASLRDSRKYVSKITGNNSMLAAEAIQELEDLNTLLSPITANTSALIKLMEHNRVLLGGPQATSFFYPICEITDCPWDFFCSEQTSNRFITGFRTSSGADLIEDIMNEQTGSRIVHFRKSINGLKLSCSIRIIVCPADPMVAIMSLKASYEQTAISYAFAIFFWPKLQQRNMYRTFDNNIGLSLYPKGKTVYQMRMQPGKKTSLKRPMTIPSVYSGTDERVEVLMFQNTERLDEDSYKAQINFIKSIVYAVFNSSTQFIGSTHKMV